MIEELPSPCVEKMLFQRMERGSDVGEPMVMVEELYFSCEEKALAQSMEGEHHLLDPRRMKEEKKTQMLVRPCRNLYQIGSIDRWNGWSEYWDYGGKSFLEKYHQSVLTQCDLKQEDPVKQLLEHPLEGVEYAVERDNIMVVVTLRKEVMEASANYLRDRLQQWVDVVRWRRRLEERWNWETLFSWIFMGYRRSRPDWVTERQDMLRGVPDWDTGRMFLRTNGDE
jgi:hypothetical protein